MNIGGVENMNCPQNIKSLEVANRILTLCWKDDCYVAPSKLMNLLILSHGWWMANTSTPLIRDEVEAWDWGPVIRPIFYKFAKWGNDPIGEKGSELNPRFMYKGEDTVRKPEVENERVDKLIEEILSVYGDRSREYLLNLLHSKNYFWYRYLDKHNYMEDNGKVSTSGKIVIPTGYIRRFFENKLEDSK